MRKRKIIFQYYRAFVQTEEKKDCWKNIECLSMDAWMYRFRKNYQFQKSIDIGATKVRFEKAKYQEEGSLWFMHIMKLREDNMPYIAKENTEAHAIKLDDDEYIGEGVYMLYDESICIAMIQRNRFSLGIARLNEFFTFIWGTDGQRIRFIPILDDIDKSLFSKRYSYRTLEVSFVNIPAKVEDDHTSLYQIKKQFSDTGAINGSIKLSLGSRRNSTLNISKTNDIISDALDDDCISALKLHIKDDDNNPVEVIDLFDKNLQSIIEFSIQERSILPFTSVIVNIEKEYKNKKSKLERLLR